MKKDMLKPLRKVDPQVRNAIEQERNRQEGINLIASESYAPQAVLEAMSCVMTNKYAEGYPGERYYGGCENVDTVETLAIQRAKEVFGADHINVQPHSGTQANMAVYLSVLDPGDTILGMKLSHGGHLSHGHPVNFSGQLFNARHYTVSKESGKLDYSEIAAVAREVDPELIVCGYSAYPRTIDFNAFREIANDVDAYLLADIAHIAGLIAADVHPSPVGKADFITATTHKTIQGPRGGFIMCKQQYANDIDKAVFPGTQGGPLMHIIAAKAVAFKRALDPEWQQMQAQIVKNAKSLGKALQDHQFKLSSGGTDNHLMLVDLRNKNITGKKAETVLNEVDITLNKNTIPYDPRSPKVTSGVRIGTPCVTMRGMKKEEMKKIAQYISEMIDNPDEETVKQKVRANVQTLCDQFPVYKDDG